MKKQVCMVALAGLLMLVQGCSSSAPAEDTISVDKKGKVTVTVVEDFDKDYYDADELAEEIEEEISAYNVNFATDRITLGEFEVEDGVAILQLVFDAGRYYADYMDVTLFSGTVAEAVEEGYDLSGSFVDPDGDVIGIEDVDDYSSKNILILEEAFAVEVPGKILAAGESDNVLITGDKTVSVLESELSYIIYE